MSARCQICSSIAFWASLPSISMPMRASPGRHARFALQIAGDWRAVAPVCKALGCRCGHGRRIENEASTTYGTLRSARYCFFVIAGGSLLRGKID
jgi:hypothetical protein